MEIHFDAVSTQLGYKHEHFFSVCNLYAFGHALWNLQLCNDMTIEILHVLLLFSIDKSSHSSGFFFIYATQFGSRKDVHQYSHLLF